MNIIFETVPYINSNLLLFEEVKYELENKGLYNDKLLFRISEIENLERIQKYGTDRGGFEGKKLWRYSSEIDKQLLHENIIYANKEDEIIKGEQNNSYISCLNKIDIIKNPLLLVYESDHFSKVYDKQYLFNDIENKKAALTAIFPINKQKKLDGWFSEEEGLFYLSLIKGIKGGRIAEIGCWKGLSTSFIGRICNKNNTKLYCIDWWQGSLDTHNSGYKEFLETEDVEATFKNNMNRLGIKVDTLKGESTQVAVNFEDNSLDMVFLDASHDYESVKKDLNTWGKKLKPGGILAGHDYNAKNDGLIKAIKEYCNNYNILTPEIKDTLWHTRK